MKKPSRKWLIAEEEHRIALARYIDLVTPLTEAEYLHQPRPGAWSTATITQHLVLLYETAAQYAPDVSPFRYRVGPIWRTTLRWLMVPHILLHRRFPVRAVAPREIRPAADPPPRDVAARELSAGAQAAVARLRELSTVPGMRFQHPYFGRLRPVPFLRLASVHLDHHRRQVEVAAAAYCAEAAGN